MKIFHTRYYDNGVSMLIIFGEPYDTSKKVVFRNKSLIF